MNADDVARYLRDNPAFFEDNAALFEDARVRHPISGQAIPLVERQVMTLRQKNRALETRLAEMLGFGEENDLTITRLHRLAVSLVAASSRAAVLGAIQSSLVEDFAVPHVAVRLWGSMAADDVADDAPVSESLREYAAGLSHPFCGVNGSFEAASWFAVAIEHIRAVAFIALRDDAGTFGLLSLGSEDPGRFYPGMGTLYLTRIGELASAALVRTLPAQTPPPETP
jgi:hypothetical protein